MITRRLHSKLNELINQYPAVVLLGPRQVGKTTLALDFAQDIKSIYLDLESTSDKAKLSEPELYLKMHEDKLVIMDEVQRVPDLFQSLRGLIDQGRRKGKKTGQFLLLGSASIELLKQSSETLAGRVAYLELTPFDVLEISDLDKLWGRGGFPDSFLAENDNHSMSWRQNFIRTYLERDIPLLGPRIPAETLRRFWVMLAHSQGGLLNAATFARNLGVDGKTIARYLDLMVDLLLVRRLMPWHTNTGKRLVKSPKVYVRDSGMLHALLGLRDKEEILSHPIVGHSWEGFIIENLVSMVPDNITPYFYATSGGAEIDLVLMLPGHKPWVIEIKRSIDPKPTKGFYYACLDIQPEKKFVVYPGNERFFIANDVEAINLIDLSKEIMNLAI